MNIKEVSKERQVLISKSNYEWQEIVRLRLDVQRDFEENQYLSISTYDKILNWKLNNQFSQIEKIKKGSPDSVIKSITKCYYEIDHPVDEMKTRIKAHVLLGIPWIGIGITSTIMAMHNPKMYGAIDSRSWSVLFNKEKKTLSNNDYLLYLTKIREIADKLECDVQEVAYILWKQYEKNNS